MDATPDSMNEGATMMELAGAAGKMYVEVVCEPPLLAGQQPTITIKGCSMGVETALTMPIDAAHNLARMILQFGMPVPVLPVSALIVPEKPRIIVPGGRVS